MICTWKDCNNKAEYFCLNREGVAWANLCKVHDKELDEAVISSIPKIILRAWVRASGGASIIVDRMFHGS
jgi:hypothetical protein